MHKFRGHFFRNASKIHLFTLIELLVVIAIVAILASLLLPVLASAVDRGKTISCVNNIRQVSMAFCNYADDFNDWMPAYLRVVPSSKLSPGTTPYAMISDGAADGGRYDDCSHLGYLSWKAPSLSQHVPVGVMRCPMVSEKVGQGVCYSLNYRFARFGNYPAITEKWIRSSADDQSRHLFIRMGSIPSAGSTMMLGEVDGYACGQLNCFHNKGMSVNLSFIDQHVETVYQARFKGMNDVGKYVEDGRFIILQEQNFWPFCSLKEGNIL